VISSTALPGPVGRSLVLTGAQVSADAVLDGGTVVGAHAVVEAGASVLGSVLQDGALVRAGAVVVDSVIGAGAVVGEGSVVRGAVVGDGAQVGAECELPPGARVWTDAVLGDRSVRMSAPDS
jgi:mannose-1-phosphate guanylyltransferase